MESILSLIDQIKTDPNHHLHDSAGIEMLEAAEKRLGVRFPEDMREFYKLCDGVCLFGREDGTYTYYFFSLEEIKSVRMLVCGSDEPQYGPRYWFGIVLVCDADYAAISYEDPLAQPVYVDIFHESFPEEKNPAVIALSFTDLLRRALGSKPIYWLQEDFSLSS